MLKESKKFVGEMTPKRPDEWQRLQKVLAEHSERGFRPLQLKVQNLNFQHIKLSPKQEIKLAEITDQLIKLSARQKKIEEEIQLASDPKEATALMKERRDLKQESAKVFLDLQQWLDGVGGDLGFDPKTEKGKKKELSSPSASGAKLTASEIDPSVKSPDAPSNVDATFKMPRLHPHTLEEILWEDSQLIERAQKLLSLTKESELDLKQKDKLIFLRSFSELSDEELREIFSLFDQLPPASSLTLLDLKEGINMVKNLPLLQKILFLEIWQSAKQGLPPDQKAVKHVINIPPIADLECRAGWDEGNLVLVFLTSPFRPKFKISFSNRGEIIFPSGDRKSLTLQNLSQVGKQIKGFFLKYDFNH
ncbi:hypothetical protein D6821_01620 [Candidatus Parcubacteria bacterium]|nr:MAG: hypothetical protein D6821_01620 [Candidatus Parcubacteria bacterium]